MIFKVQTKLQGVRGWLALGELKDVLWGIRLTEVTYAELLDAGECGDYLTFDNPFEESTDVPDFDPNNQLLQCKRVIITDKLGKQITVWFDGIAYLMNDDGKTVETIYGY